MDRADRMTEKPTMPIRDALIAVMKDIRPISKDRFNREQGFRFRGVEDVMNALADPFRKHGVYVLPEVLETSNEVRQTKSGGVMNATRMRVAFHFHGPAGDQVTAVTAGEGADMADKATNKAMAAAFKYALLYAFMIPTEGTLDDSDAEHPEGAAASPPPPREPTKDLIRQWVDGVYEAKDLDALRRVWTGIAGSGMQDTETLDHTGEPITLNDLATRRRRELEKDGEPDADTAG